MIHVAGRFGVSSALALALLVAGCSSSSKNGRNGELAGSGGDGNGSGAGSGGTNGGAGSTGTGTAGTTGGAGNGASGTGGGGTGGNGNGNGDAGDHDAAMDMDAGMDAAMDAAMDMDAAADGGGESAACKALHCGTHQVCDESGSSAVCVCDTGYTDVGGGTCKADDGTTCTLNGDCANAHCVSQVCCASACDTPDQCHVATGATCGNGSTCTYTNVTNGMACNDGSACTSNDKCMDGTCGGTTVDCDDTNPCTADSCDTTNGCVNDGTGITVSCGNDDNCHTGYLCQGDPDGTCLPTTTKDCSAQDDDCNAGYCDSSDGSCKKKAASNGLGCEDGNVCTSGETCNNGTCGGGSTTTCNDGNPCTDDMCDSQLGCVAMNNSMSCDDGNPCTIGDTCSGGSCKQNTPRDCNDSNGCTDDSCNPAKLSGDPCVHANNTASCNDSDSCTSTDVCSGGSCMGSGNACGANASMCTAGTPNTCVCNGGYVPDGNGSCVPTTNECNANPCDANATCNDPSSAMNDYTCTCKAGYTGDGKPSGTGCTDIDECAGNPCGAGRGTCTQNAPGQGYTCACAGGFMQVGGTCSCDLNGRFAIRVAETVKWSGITGIEDSNDATHTTPIVLYSWAIRDQTYDAQGNLHVVTTPCGGTSADLCGTGNAFLGISPEAYAQFLPIQIWGTSGMPTETVNMSLPLAISGTTFKTNPSATLLGISLTDPMGTWPGTRAGVGAGAMQVNGAVWTDDDSDTKPGVTTYAVPPGGFPVDGTAPDPLTAYPAMSTDCPRLSSGARDAYNYWPAPEVSGFTIAVRRTKRFYVASRTIGYFDGTLSSCDLITGAVKGPANGQVQNDARINSCVRVSGTGETTCSDAVIDFYDTSDQTAQQIQSAAFIIKRMANNATCTDARAAAYP
jgi:hypothetical protein